MRYHWLQMCFMDILDIGVNFKAKLVIRGVCEAWAEEELWWVVS